MTPGQDVLERLRPYLQREGAEGGLELTVDEPMSRHTTLRLGGPADVWARPATRAALVALVGAAHRAGVPVTTVGSGTNLLVLDGGIRGVVVNLARLATVRRIDDGALEGGVEVEAGASTGRLLSRALAWGLGGVEFLGGVPGSVGGGLVMNAGTYLGEFGDVVLDVTSVRPDGHEVLRPAAACGFRYRGSDLPAHEIVAAARLRLIPRPRADMDAAVTALRARRREREPHGVPNAGSTFKNPPGDYAGRLIETAGLKGTRAGGALVSPVHANWIVVDPDRAPPCRAADVVALMELVRSRVAQVHGVELQPELRLLGEP